MQTHRSVLSSLRNFIEFQKGRNEQIYEWDSAPVLIFPERRRSIVSDKYEIAVKTADQKNAESESKLRQNLTYAIMCRLSGNS